MCSYEGYGKGWHGMYRITRQFYLFREGEGSRDLTVYRYADATRQKTMAR
jgi:hypothetical protein